MNKNFYKKLGMIALLGAIIVPQLTFAAGPFEKRREQKINKNEVQFCTGLTNRANGWMNTINEKNVKIDLRRNEQLNKKTQNRSDRDTKIEQHRDGWDNNRGDRFEKLEAKATTDAQKAAVAEFKSTVTTAISTRRSAIDSAISTFRSGVDALNTSNKTAIDAAITNFKTAYQAALTKATADCAAGVDSKTVKATFESSIKAAHETFKATKESIVKKTAIEALGATRKAAVTKAVEDFKTVLQAAQQKLQLAFPKQQ
ncbi:MAG TPA: hypothetical protein PKZ56_01665 [Candidatus Paceibacterota bacterium]|jgi:hypothetical protein|nr:hypothetical protein [Candidatus Paceibacterota bacterium]